MAHPHDRSGKDSDQQVEDSCGCVFCDLGLDPYELLGQWWHKNAKAPFQPARCYRLSPEPKE